MVALLTPVAKAFLTDRALDTCVIGQQVFGGHGYIREWGQEQLVRDTRITQIYEGTNGIQAMDLMGRKVVGNNGQFFEYFANDVADFITENQNDPALEGFIQPLAAAIERLSDVTEHVIKSSGDNPTEVGAAAVDYLDLFGLTAEAYLWARMVKAAKTQGGKRYFRLLHRQTQNRPLLLRPPPAPDRGTGRRNPQRFRLHDGVLGRRVRLIRVKARR